MIKLCTLILLTEEDKRTTYANLEALIPERVVISKRLYNLGYVRAIGQIKVKRA